MGIVSIKNVSDYNRFAFQIQTVVCKQFLVAGGD